MKYDLTIAHRVCPRLSKTAVGFADKREMVIRTTESLKRALMDLKVKLHVILDGCADFESIFKEAFCELPNVDLLIEKFDNVGNQMTYGRQVEILSAVEDSECVYFSEDDYIYDESAFRAMLDFIKREGIDMVSPIDHPDRYGGRLEKPHPVMIATSRYCHWREVGSTCLTFMAKASVVRKSRKVFEAYVHSSEEATTWLALTKDGVFDVPRLFWSAIRYAFGRKLPFGEVMALCTWKRQGLRLLTSPRYHLWSPIPTLAVHLSSASLSLHSERLVKNLEMS